MATAAASNRLLQVPLHSSFFIMQADRNLLIGMLRQGKTGDQLLQILDVITADIQSDVQEDGEPADIQF
jgi:hypothetical protein